MSKVNELLDESIAADGFAIRPDDTGRAVIDLVKIDFDKLAKRDSGAARQVDPAQQNARRLSDQVRGVD